MVFSAGVRPRDGTDSYIGETTRRLSERVIDQAGRDAKSHIVRHCLSSYHEKVNIKNFKILKLGYNNKLIKGEYLRHYL